MSGGRAALPLWTAFMTEATAGLPPRPFLPPPGVTMVRLDRASGDVLAPGVESENVLVEAFLDADAPAAAALEHDAAQAAEPAPGAGREDGLREEHLTWDDSGRARQTPEGR
jgi:penicillin-binding protein 1A